MSGDEDFAQVIPDYYSPASQELPPLNRHWLIVARSCGALPLALGVLDFLLWLITRAKPLELIGVIMIELGLVIFATGVVALLVHVVINWRRLHFADDRRRHWKSIILAMLLLLSNFLVCAAIIAAVQMIDPPQFLD